MKIGKVSEITYKRSVLKHISEKSEGLKPGVDGAPISLEDITVVVSSNCILKLFEGCEEYYLQKTINAVCEKGGIPNSIQLQINIPIDYEEKLLAKIVRNFNNSAGRRNLSVEQCRVYASKIEMPIIHITVIGTTTGNFLSGNIKEGMDVVMTGSIAIGTTAIMSQKYEQRLREKFSSAFVKDCIQMKEYLSVENAAKVAADKGAVYMHSVSDGGIFAAVWELASCSNLGITVDIPNIPVWQETVEVAETFDYNPYQVDGTGSLLIVCEDGNKMTEELYLEGIYANVIGKLTSGNDRVAVNGDETRYLEPPRGDELYNFI